jgi:hypothetical protein
MHSNPVFLSLMVHQKEILDKLAQELCCELKMEVWYTFYRVDCVVFICYFYLYLYLTLLSA